MHGIPQPTFCAVLGQVLEALLRQVQRHIALPTTPAQFNAMKAQFHAIAQMPYMIAALDCIHFALVSPQAHKAVYQNRKHYHSMNVQVTCDPNLIITHCCARYPVSTHKAMVLRNSTLSGYMKRHRGQWTWIVEDSGYPQLPWLMTPVRDPQTSQEIAYDHAHSRTRVCIERTFGLLKAQFCCPDRTGGALMYATEKVCKNVLVCAMLHNICRRWTVPLPPDMDMPPPEDEEAGPLAEANERIACDDVRDGRYARQGLIENLF
ncbi:putative nuclease HARBI1 [Ambystoma mexicanum]|uniref:putative nuclease HARBI1 n=1 Tax=Ambystoma mexicanum TaxID=8296 RepID=UPI0037E76049